MARSTVQGVAKILQGEKLQLGTNRISMKTTLNPAAWPGPTAPTSTAAAPIPHPTPTRGQRAPAPSFLQLNCMDTAKVTLPRATPSRENLTDHSSVNIGQPEIAALKTVSEAFVLDSEQVQ